MIIELPAATAAVPSASFWIGTVMPAATRSATQIAARRSGQRYRKKPEPIGQLDRFLLGLRRPVLRISRVDLSCFRRQVLGYIVADADQRRHLTVLGSGMERDHDPHDLSPLPQLYTCRTLPRRTMPALPALTKWN